MSYRIGLGTDFHQLVTGRKFWLGGIEIPHSKGALGHSDADVLLHAICDALLGALNLGDIGIHFPDTDPSLQDIDSKILLEKTYRLIQEKGYRIVNLDTVICLEKPKIMHSGTGHAPDHCPHPGDMPRMIYRSKLPRPKNSDLSEEKKASWPRPSYC